MPSQASNRSFCSSACRDAYRRSHLGPASPYYKRVRAACLICGADFDALPARAANGTTYCSPACGRMAQRLKVSAAAKARRKVVYESVDRGIRRSKQRDGYACRLCGFAIVVNGHHIIARVAGGSNSIQNIITLCPNHHAMVHAGLIKADILFAALKAAMPLFEDTVLSAKHKIRYRQSTTA